MLTGKDEEDNFLGKKFEKKRNKGLEDKSKLTSIEVTFYEIEGDEGGGRTNPDTFKIKQHPFPIDSSIRRKKNVYITNEPVVE